MEYASCNVIYVDRAVRQDRYIQESAQSTDQDPVEWESSHIAQNVKLLLHVFGEVHLCSTGGACLTQWLNLQDVSMVDLKPTLILIDTPFQDQIPERSRSRSPSPHSPPDEDGENHEEELYGLALLQRIISESYIRNLSKLVVPVAVVSFPRDDRPDGNDGSSDVREEIANGKLHVGSSKIRRAANRRMLKRCLDLGATDVMASPMNGKCVTNLEVHAYRAHRDAARDQKTGRGRHRSWVGVEVVEEAQGAQGEEQPYAYLRESMVAGLMGGICRIENKIEDGVGKFKVAISSEKQAQIASAVGQWHFCAHSFDDNELIVASSIIFNHALAMPELEQWRIPTDQLHSFVIACRAAYNHFVPYHNFRHVVDVLQATFNFLVHIGALPPYPPSGASPPVALPKSPMALLLQPFEALTLLITAIGHDVGHPGVNNGFLITLNTPLAQLYNDRSVLESFHCAAFSQILRRHWPSAFSDKKMRSLMISSILATDMGLHFDYMKRLGNLQAKLSSSENGTDGWEGRMIDEENALACALLIKCADISNVARRHDTALQWMHTLSEEFSRQASMENELAIPTSLMAQPRKEIVALARAQLGFMNLFAIPLFQGVADILPAMKYCVDELLVNKSLFEKCVADEVAKELKSLALAAGTRDHELETPVPRLVEVRSTTEESLTSQQTEPAPKPSQASEEPVGYKKDNEVLTTFDAVADFARSDPFHINRSKSQVLPKQRCSETTEGSSAPYAGDWASQATSATTGKMPLSPSTQGTSIISTESMDRPSSVPVTTITAPDLTPPTLPDLARSQPELVVDGNVPVTPEVYTNGHNYGRTHLNGHAKEPKKAPEAELDPGKTIRKRPSRFKMNPLQIFRKNKSSTPPVPSADSAG
ncbi:hypothetical protein B0T19DRAFT_119466 [Cercophora scortea]|uniref:Phosphodiesterase n=1 Tax=Cercophora scortea TaxID=314031 RepID=A0AAE0MI89_9PEZI|nr:hypothetical protein B0T19DRAFT_119466 [Cercophora scortea]